MTEAQVLEQIDAIVRRTLEDKGLKPSSVDAGTQLLGGELRIDSLDLAMLVRELEDVVGHDPFAEGELAKLYAK
jgi:acyl carrier protein